MLSYQKRWALITGASAGIGAEFAKQLAATGANLVLTARRIDRLEKLASDLEAQFGIQVLCIAADLAKVDAIPQLCRALQTQQIEIDILINNAGFGLPGDYHTQDWEAHRQSLQVLLTAPCELTRALLPAMQRRGFGRIVNVASLAGFAPSSAGHTTYGAIKSFLIRFSECLRLENIGKGVHVSALCPGFTYTEFHDVNGARGLVNRLPKFMFQQVDFVVAEGLRALEHNQAVCVTGNWNKFVATMSRHLPYRFASWLVNRKAADFRERKAD